MDIIQQMNEKCHKSDQFDQHIPEFKTKILFVFPQWRNSLAVCHLSHSKAMMLILAESKMLRTKGQ